MTTVEYDCETKSVLEAMIEGYCPRTEVGQRTLPLVRL